jgi:hypothetical protein
LTSAAFLPGRFVWCRFPFSEKPGEPGDKEHIGYIADIRRNPAGRLVVMVLYTTSRQWEDFAPKPLGILSVDLERARAMGQERPFVLDARRIAFLPVDPAFFPRLSRPDRGIIGVAPLAF